jgi:mono/diheme cytochrome c family protein
MNSFPRLLLCGLLIFTGCRNCPIVSCHTRKAHLHGGTKYRGQPLWKKQNPAVGEKIRTENQGSSKPKNDRSKPLR